MDENPFFKQENYSLSDCEMEDFQMLFRNCHLLDETTRLKFMVNTESVLEKLHDELVECDFYRHDLNEYKLELIYRIYYTLLSATSSSSHKNFMDSLEKINLPLSCLILEAILTTNYHKIITKNAEGIKKLHKKCEELFKEMMRKNSSTCLKRVLNGYSSLCIHYKITSEEIRIDLEDFYLCIEYRSNQIRAKALDLFHFKVKKLKNAREFFEIISNFWPWSNKVKLLMLNVILKIHHIKELTKLDAYEKGSPTLLAAYFDEKNFFNGLRFSLQNKSLCSAGQSLLETLLKQNLEGINEFLEEILIKNGTEEEISNILVKSIRSFFQKPNEIFINFIFAENEELMISHEMDFSSILGRKAAICNLFYSYLHREFILKNIINNLRKEYLKTTEFGQLQIFILIVEHQLNRQPSNSSDDNDDYSLEENLEFILHFLNQNSSTSCSSFRQNILGRMPICFSALAYKYKKMKENSTKIFEFFQGLSDLYLDCAKKSEYQPLIFALKLMNLLLSCLFPIENKRVTKSDNLSLNKELGRELQRRNVLKVNEIQETLINLLETDVGYDDVQELTVNISHRLKVNCSEKALHCCRTANSSSDIDKCNLSRYFIEIALSTNKLVEVENCSNLPETLFNKYLKKVDNITANFEEDPLEICKTGGGHLFGYVNCMNVIIKSMNFNLNSNHISNCIRISKNIFNRIITLLSLTENDETVAPSFETMDESLQILVRKSRHKSTSSNDEDRKFLLLTFWMSLKACCDLTRSVGLHCLKISKGKRIDSTYLNFLGECLNFHVDILCKCRHKGAIEAAGDSLGVLIKEIATRNSSSPEYNLIHDSCFAVILKRTDKISTTRRGAGLSIMLHHIIKNESQRNRPLFVYIVENLLKELNKSLPLNILNEEYEKYENREALILHYMCALVKAIDFNENTCLYFDQMMKIALQKVEDEDWRIRNGALQLFGHLVPKVTGQKQGVLIEGPIIWESKEITFSEIFLRLRYAANYIPRKIPSIILFLEFMSKINYIYKSDRESEYTPQFNKLREIFWNYLLHRCDKIRKLAARCIACSHDFRCGIPEILGKIIKLLFDVDDENFREGLILCCIECIHKFEYESKFISEINQDVLYEKIQEVFKDSYKFIKLSFYSRYHLLEFLSLINFRFEDEIILEIISSKKNCTIEILKSMLNDKEISAERNLGYYVWKDKVSSLYNFI